MSLLIENEIACLYCKYPNQAEVWSIINVKSDPELKDLLLGGELNMVECQSCKKVFFAEKFLIYHDPDREMMAFVYPYDHRKEREKWEKKTQDDFAMTQLEAEPEGKLKYKPVTFFGLDELVRYVEEDEEVSVQSEIVSIMADQQGFSVRPLRPSLARHQGVPYVVPYLRDSAMPFNKAVLGALGEIEKENDRLSAYTRFRMKLAASPAQEILFE